MIKREKPISKPSCYASEDDQWLLALPTIFCFHVSHLFFSKTFLIALRISREDRLTTNRGMQELRQGDNFSA